MAPRKTDTKTKATKTPRATARAKSAKPAKPAARAKAVSPTRSKTAATRAKATGTAKSSRAAKSPSAAKTMRSNRAAATRSATSRNASSRNSSARGVAARAAVRKASIDRPAPVALPVVPAGPVYQAEDRDRFEGILLAARLRLLKEMGHLEDTVLNRSLRDSSGELSGYSFHMADIGTDAMEREKAFLFASAEGRALIDINEALRRLYNGEYGNCESCGNPISTARLEVVPQARMCVSCKQEEERSQGGRGR